MEDVSIIDLEGGSDQEGQEDEEELFDYGEDLEDDEVEIIEIVESQRASQSPLKEEGGGGGGNSGEQSEEAAARAALVAAAAETGESCWWCMHPELAGSWLRAFVGAGEEADGEAKVLFEKLKGHTYECLGCQDRVRLFWDWGLQRVAHYSRSS